MRRRLLNLFPLASLALLLAVLALWPRHGPPHFRYSGSDLAHPVWNLGWPLALAIYDPSNGLHIGPFGVMAAYAFVCVWGIYVVMRWIIRQVDPLRSDRLKAGRCARCE